MNEGRTYLARQDQKKSSLLFCYYCCSQVGLSELIISPITLEAYAVSDPYLQTRVDPNNKRFYNESQ